MIEGEINVGVIIKPNDPDWTSIGFESTPQGITNIVDFAKNIQDNWDSSITNMSNKYLANNDLFIFPLVDTSNVTNMTNAFNGSSLSDIALIDTSKVSDMNNTFRACRIEDIPLLNMSNVIDLGYCFAGCVNLKTIPKFNTSNVHYMGSVFSGCSSLKNIPVLDTKQVYNNQLMNCFANCPLLSNESLNNIMEMCINAQNGGYATKTLRHVGLSQEQTEVCKTLSNWEELVAKGWTTGY